MYGKPHAAERGRGLGACELVEEGVERGVEVLLLG